MKNNWILPMLTSPFANASFLAVILFCLWDLSHGLVRVQLHFAQRVIAPSIPPEQTDDRSVSAHCAESDLSERRSSLWGIG